MVDNAPTGGGEWFDEWDQLAKENALVAFKVKRLMEPTVLKPKMPAAEPVVVDFAVLTGTQKGLVYRDEKIIKRAITDMLRTKREKIGKRTRPVPRQPGEEIAARIEFYESHGRDDHVKAASCTDAEFEEVKRVFAEYHDDPWTGMEREELAAAGVAVPGVQNADAGGADTDDLPF